MSQLSQMDAAGSRYKAVCEVGSCPWTDRKFRTSDASTRRFERHLRWRHGISPQQYAEVQQKRFDSYRSGGR